MRCHAQATLLRPRLRATMLDPLAEAGLRPLVLKGAALADRYPEPGLRPMDDIDLLFPKDQQSEAIEVLRKCGWRTVRHQEPHYAVALAHPDLPGLPLDIHRDLSMPEERAFHLTVSDLWAAREPSRLADAAIYGLAPEAEIVLLATHSAKRFHTFDRLLWPVDAAVVITSSATTGRDIDWSSAEEWARRSRAESAVAVLLSQAGRLGVPSPPSLRRLRCSQTRQRMLQPLLQADWPLRELDDPIRHRLAYALVDDPRLRLRLAAREITESGWERAPVKAFAMMIKVLRRSWWLRRGRIN
jgi:hypothetical protein